MVTVRKKKIPLSQNFSLVPSGTCSMPATFLLKPLGVDHIHTYLIGHAPLRHFRANERQSRQNGTFKNNC